MTRLPNLNSPFLLGFDDIERALDRVSRTTSDGYPPYNIERLQRSEADPERLRITLAVAGFTRDQLDITVEETSCSSVADRSRTKTGNICIVALQPVSSSAHFCSPKACRFWVLT